MTRKCIALLLSLLMLISVSPAFAALDAGTVELYSQKKEAIEIYDQIIADFSAENPDVKVVQTTTADGSTFLGRVASNDIPDIGGVFLQSAYFNMMDEEYFLDLSGEEFLTKVSPEIVTLASRNGKNYVLPITMNGYALYVNTDIFTKHNLAVPTTYDELIANCEALKAAGVNPIALPGKSAGNLGQNYERLLGGCVDHEAWKISEAVAKGASHKDYPAFVEYIEKWYALTRYAGVDPLSTTDDDCNRMFANGEVAMLFSGTWGNSVFMSLNPDLKYEGVVPPTFSGVEPFTCGTVDIALAIGADSDNIEGAKKFLNYFVSEGPAQKFAEGDKNPNVVLSTSYEIPHMSAISAAMQDGRFALIPSTYWPAGYRDEVQILLQQLLLDGDVNAFIESMDTMTVDFYADAE